MARREIGSVAEESLQEKQARSFRKARTEIAEHRNWFILLGAALLVVGALAIAFPFVSTIATKIYLGWLFLIGGVVQIAHCFSTQRWSQFFLNLLIGLLYIIAGGWLAFFPLTGILTLTVLLAVMFLVEGAIETIMAFRLRPQDGWAWLLLAGIVAALVGLLIVGGLPGTAVWAIGMLAGINMLSTGWAFLFLALRSQPAEAASQTPA
jgi:uncharacterized membrane protein HdeD (DUF308 family)